MLVLLSAAEETGEATRTVLPHTDELIWVSVAFLVFFLILAKLAFPGLAAALRSREEGIRGELERAEQARLDAEEQMEEYRGRLAEARAEADRIVREASESIEEIRRDRIARAEEEARQIVERARQDAGRERDRVLGELRREMANISIEAARRVVQKELADPDAQRQLVEQFIAGSSGSSTNGGGG